MPVYAALEKRRSANTDMHTCTLDTSIRAIIEAVGLTDREVLRLLVVEEEESAVGGGGCDGGDRGVAQRKKLAGIVTGYDILSFLLSESRSVDSEGKSEFAAATPSIVSFAEPAA